MRLIIDIATLHAVPKKRGGRNMMSSRHNIRIIKRAVRAFQILRLESSLLIRGTTSQAVPKISNIETKTVELKQRLAEIEKKLEFYCLTTGTRKIYLMKTNQNHLD